MVFTVVARRFADAARRSPGRTPSSEGHDTVKRLTPLLTITGLITVATALAGCSSASPETADRSAAVTRTAEASPSQAAASAAFLGLEGQYDARLGVYAVDTGTGKTVGYRADERFAYASTHKVLSAGAILRSDADLDQVVRYAQSDLVEYSPITEKNVATGMPLREVIAAALQYSDNTAANLMFRQLGGPSALGDALASIGDRTTRVARIEPDLNEATPGDTRDTTTPKAIAKDLRTLALGGALPQDKRTLLTDWMKGNTTGATVIRAGVPTDWTVGDKTGSGGYGTRNDIAVLWPSSGAPIVLAVMSSKSTEEATRDDALIAAAAREAMVALGRDR
jgi:beta-lactamase class A